MGQLIIGCPYIFKSNEGSYNKWQSKYSWMHGQSIDGN
jgi:hypothetical protein